MGGFSFWQKWLFSFGLYLVAFGTVLALFSHSALINVIFNNQINPSFWASGAMPENAIKFQAWVYGVLGATIAGWGIFIAFIAHYPFKAKEPWAWQCIAIGFALWFTIDTLVSVYYQVGFNVLVNLVFIIFILLPLIFTKKHF